MSRLLSDLVRGHGGLRLASVRDWVSRIGSWMAEGAAGEPHLETVGLLARRNDVQMLEAVFDNPKEIISTS